MNDSLPARPHPPPRLPARRGGYPPDTARARRPPGPARPPNDTDPIRGIEWFYVTPEAHEVMGPFDPAKFRKLAPYFSLDICVGNHPVG